MMITNILIYRWGSNSESPLIQQLKSLNIAYLEFEQKMQNYHADSLFAEKMMEVIHKNQVNAVFSFDYFPLISMICEINRIPYITWIYDCPMPTLMSETLSNDSNYIYCFDGNYTERLIKGGAKHCFHFPLGGNGKLFQWITEQEKGNVRLTEKYACDISFLGSLYNGENNRYRTAKLGDYTHGFLEGVINTQIEMYGYNFVKEVLPDFVVDELEEVCELKVGNMYCQDRRQMAADVVNMEITARERERVLGLLGTEYQVTLYTGGEVPAGFKLKNIENRGYADYDKEMPFIFHNSKINLNVTSRSIESGVPLRIFDILSCGGFCLTNYQAEVSELFENGVELVMYTSMEDMLDKVKYYLSHDKERIEIAHAGYKKLVTEYDLLGKVRDMFHFLNEG